MGTRGSKLATTQCGMLVDELKRKNPGVEFELKIIKTSGDANQKSSLSAMPGLGVFVKELEIALMEDEIDLAVHSLKDVPHTVPQQLQLSSFPKREEPNDVFISDGKAFKELPAGAVVGTGSPRRILQLKKIRGDVEYKDIRGNIDSRVQKVLDGELDGIILARAGLNRLNVKVPYSENFDVNEVIPAIGQGVLAIETRKGDEEVIEIARTVNDSWTEGCVYLERQFMERIGGGCKVPMAAIAYHLSEKIAFKAILGSGDFSHSVIVEDVLHNWQQRDEFLDQFIQKMVNECKEQSIALPSELPEHNLLKKG